MKNDPENLLEKAAKCCGYRLKVYSDADDDANDIIARDFEEHAADFLEIYNEEEYSRYRNGIRVFCRFVEPIPAKVSADSPAALDVMVVPLGYRDVHQFAIFISTHILNGLSSLFTALAAGPEQALVGINENVIAEKFEEDIYPRILSALLFIFFHEFAHIIRAHIPFYFAERYARLKSSENLSFHLVNQATQEATIDRIRVHRAMEIDADLLAIGLILEFISNNELENAFLFPENLVSDPEVMGEAISILIRLLDLWRKSIAGNDYQREMAMHPHPDIRQIFLESWMMAREKNDTAENFKLATRKFKTGTEKGMKTMELFGHQLLPNLEYIRREGTDSSLQEYELLRNDLDEYLRPALSNFTV